MDIKRVNNMIINITAAFKNMQIYEPTHQLIERSVIKTIDALNDIYNELDEVTIMIIESELIVKNFQFGKLVTCSMNLARTLKEHGIERLTFTKGIQKDELSRFVADFKKTGKELTIRATKHIMIGKVKVEAKIAELAEDDKDDNFDDADKAHELMDREEFEKLQELYISIQKHKKLNIVGIEDIVVHFIDTFKQELSPLLSLATLKSFDEYTYVHAANVCILTMAQAEFLNFTDSVLHDIGVAAMVHDVGKTFIPEEVLNKKGKLTPEEWGIMMSHPTQGAKYLANTSGIPNIAVLVAYEHHMKHDLSGYPKVNGSYKIHPCSQMTNISDFFDALSTVRPYREPLSKYKIFEMLREGAGTEFEPFLVETFITMMQTTKKNA